MGFFLGLQFSLKPIRGKRGKIVVSIDFQMKNSLTVCLTLRSPLNQNSVNYRSKLHILTSSTHYKVTHNCTIYIEIKRSPKYLQIWREICQHTKIVTISLFGNFMTKHPIQTLGINLSWNNGNNSLTPNLSL